MSLQASKNIFNVIVLALLLIPCATLSGAKRPNVVMLLADDLGWKDIACYDGPVKTPTLDRLAAGGVRFTDFYAGAAVCSPSRATLLTGRQHLRAGVYSWIHDYSQESHLLEREVTLAEVLKSNGYETVHLGKWHLGMPTPQKPNKPTPSDHGFDYWFATANNAQPSHKDPANFIRNGTLVGKTDGYACQVVVDEAIAWLDETRDRNKPFFLNVWFHEPHAPIAAPDEIVSRYGNLNDPAAIYSGTIDNTDRAIARLLEKLKQVDSPANTLIIYSSDNGSYRADRVGHLRGIKGSNYEGGIRVPGIFCWPGTITGGHVEHEPAGLVDLPNWPIAVLFVGTEGMLITAIEVLPIKYELHPKAKFAEFQPPPQTISRSIGHYREWIEACRAGGSTTCSFDYSGPLTETVLLGNVAYRTGEKLQWDAENLKAVNCPEADQFIRREYRQGWAM